MNKPKRTRPVDPAFTKSDRTAALLRGRAAAGLCARCGVNPHSSGEGSTSWYCASCAEKNRSYFRIRARLKLGKPLSDPMDRRGRPRKNPSGVTPK